MRLNWTDYKSMYGSRSVYFGDFQLYVVQTDRNFRETPGQWRVTWYRDGNEVRAREMPGLTDQFFKNRRLAQLAAERIFVPVARIAPGLVRVDVKVVTDERALP